MSATNSIDGSDRANRIEWRLYLKMLTTRVLEEALVHWEHEKKHSAQTFPSKGQEAIPIGTCLALEKGDDVLPSFRTRGAMIGMGIGIEEQLREFLHTSQRQPAIRATRRITRRGRSAARCPVRP